MKNIAEQIVEGLSKFYVGFQNRRVLKTMEEIEANTDEQNIPSALLLGELYNKLMFPSGTEFFLDEHDGERGYNTSATRGADTFVPFRRTDIVMEYMFANGYNQPGNSRTMTYTAKHDCTLHIRGCSGAYGSNRATIQSYLNSSVYNLRTVQGYCGETHTADISLNKGDVFSVSCSINSNGGAICLIGYID